MSTFVDDGNGYFSPFAFTFRNNYNAKSPCIVYFDGVTVKLKNVKTHYTFEEGMGKAEIPYGEKAAVGTYYGYSSFMMMNETQAKAAGVPGAFGQIFVTDVNRGHLDRILAAATGDYKLYTVEEGIVNLHS